MDTLETDLGWSTIDRLARTLAERLPAACGVGGFDRVIGVARGGLVPAVLLATHLGVKRLESVQVRLYDGDRKLPEPTLVGPAPDPVGPSGEARRTLIVDEIVDSGSTVRFLADLVPGAALACLVARAGPRPLPRRHGLVAWPCEGSDAPTVWAADDLATERWILFPWSPPEDRVAGAATP